MEVGSIIEADRSIKHFETEILIAFTSKYTVSFSFLDTNAPWIDVHDKYRVVHVGLE